MKRKEKIWSVRTIAEIGIFAALGYVLDLLAGIYSSPLFPNGGAIGIAMLCVFVVSFRRGFLPGMLTGLIMGLLDILDGFYVISGAEWYMSFLQVALDYWLAYPLAGLAGVVANLVKKANTKKKMVLWVSVGCLIGGSLKYISHVLSGAIFWGADAGSFAWSFKDSTISPWAYSFIYNIAYMGPDIFLCTLLADVLIVIWPKAIHPEEGWSWGKQTAVEAKFVEHPTSQKEKGEK